MKISTERGVFHGFCATPDCPNVAVWIPISHGRMESPKYHCKACCDRISAEVNRVEVPASVSELSRAVVDLDANAANEHAEALTARVANLLAAQIAQNVNTYKITQRDVAVILIAHGATWWTVDRWARSIAATIKSDMAAHRLGGNI